MLFRTLFLALVACGVLGQHTDKGPLHQGLTAVMNKYPHLRRIKVGYVEMHEPPFCDIRVKLATLGEYGFRTTYMYSRHRGCTLRTVRLWEQAIPCTLVRGSPHTTCRGPLPPGAEKNEWNSHDAITLPARFTGPFSSKPVLNAPSVPRPATLDCETLERLIVAKTVQHSGVYTGTGTISCENTDSAFNVALDGSGVESTLKLHKDIDNTEAYKRVKPISWNAGFDNMNHLSVSINGGPAMWYDKRDLDAASIFLVTDGYTDYTLDFKSRKGESRLCPHCSLTGACFAMATVTDADRVTLGNVTGFFVDRLTTSGSAVFMDGLILGTDGVITASYQSLGYGVPAQVWLELPFYGSKCIPRMYPITQCSSIPDGAPIIPGYRAVAKTPVPFPTVS